MRQWSLKMPRKKNVTGDSSATILDAKRPDTPEISRNVVPDPVKKVGKIAQSAKKQKKPTGSIKESVKKLSKKERRKKIAAYNKAKGIRDKNDGEKPGIDEETTALEPEKKKPKKPKATQAKKERTAAPKPVEKKTKKSKAAQAKPLAALKKAALEKSKKKAAQSNEALGNNVGKAEVDDGVPENSKEAEEEKIEDAPPETSNDAKVSIADGDSALLALPDGKPKIVYPRLKTIFKPLPSTGQAFLRSTSPPLYKFRSDGLNIQVDKGGNTKEIPQFFNRMCLTEEEKVSGKFFEEHHLRQRKKERDKVIKKYRQTVKDMKESYKVAKKKRRLQIKEALELIGTEHEVKLAELLAAPAPEIRPWLGEKEPKKKTGKPKAGKVLNSPRGSVRAMSINDGLEDMGMDILEGTNVATLRHGYTIDPKWERLSQPYKKKIIQEDVDDKNQKRPYFVEHMALTKEEKLNMISMVSKRDYYAEEYLAKKRDEENSKEPAKKKLEPAKTPVSNVGRRPTDYSNVYRLPENAPRIEPKPIQMWLPLNPPQDKNVIKHNFPGPKDEVDALAWDMHGQKYFTANKLEKKRLRLLAEAEYVVVVRKKNLQWIKDNKANLEIYKRDIRIKEATAVRDLFVSVNKRLRTLSFGLKSMYKDDAAENRIELLKMLNAATSADGGLNKIIEEAVDRVGTEFKDLSGAPDILERYTKLQADIKRMEKTVTEDVYKPRKDLAADAERYHAEAKARRLQVNEEFKADEKVVQLRLQNLMELKDELGAAHDAMRVIPRVKKRPPPKAQKCWVCKMPLKFDPGAEFCFCTGCSQFNQNKRAKPKIFASKNKTKARRIRSLNDEVNTTCKKIGKAVLEGQTVSLGTFANVRRLERLADKPVNPVSPGPGWYRNLDDTVLADRAGKGKRFSLAPPGTLDFHLEEQKFLKRLRGLDWSDRLKAKIIENKKANRYTKGSENDEAKETVMNVDAEGKESATNADLEETVMNVDAEGKESATNADLEETVNVDAREAANGD